jgi:hypothetical protein
MTTTIATLKHATFRKSTERLDNGTPTPWQIQLSGFGSEYFTNRLEALERIEDLKVRGYKIAYFA